jgi:4-aminobutyrate aminotransferase-like enzyme
MSYPDTLVCPLPKVFGSGLADDGRAGARFGADCRDRLIGAGGSLAAFIAEPIVGCGGQVPLPAGYLQAVYPAIRAQGGVCISDEVQVGFGRLGRHFWGFEMQGVIPDIVVLGKPMGNGHPMGAVVCTSPIADAFAQGPEFFSSFGGNPVSCAIGQAVLEVIEREGLATHAGEVGHYLADGLRQLQAQYPHIADVRGTGLFLGVELADSQGNPATQWAQTLKDGLRERQVLVGTDGPYESVLKIKPPLPFEKNNCEELLCKIEAIIKGIGFI